MPKIVKELSAVAVRNLKKPGFHAVGGVPGLLLHVTKGAGRSWVLRATIAGRVRHAGLGSYSVVSLAQARDKAREMRSAILDGRDPIEERKAKKRALQAERAARLTFKEAAQLHHKKKAAELRSQGHVHDWLGSLERYAFPYIGNTPVDEITLLDMKKVLDPIWYTKTGGTAENVRRRIETVLTWATVSGHRQGDNPARWVGNLKEIYPARSKIHKKRHRQALPWQEAPAFMQRLRERHDPASFCLEFLILTAARPREARLTEWSEIDLDAKVWTLPPERMKSNKLHRVPLCQDLVKLLSNIERRHDRYVFALSQHKPVSGDYLLKAARAIVPGIDVHGFRSTFKDWARNRTQFPDEVSELALAHVNSSETRSAYARDELLPQRAKLMEAWASYVRKPVRSAEVVDIGRATA